MDASGRTARLRSTVVDRASARDARGAGSAERARAVQPSVCRAARLEASSAVDAARRRAACSGVLASVVSDHPVEPRDELEADVAALREEVARLGVELASARARILEECEPEIVRLAMTVATRVVGRELEADPSLVLGWVQEGLAVLPGKDAPVLAVAPDIASAISLEDQAAIRSVVVDASLRPGTCELREGSSVVEIGADERLAAISDALGIEKERP